ncbi:hypothetical protein LXL04_021300 [Taraxacum kok-saghyz]
MRYQVPLSVFFPEGLNRFPRTVVDAVNHITPKRFWFREKPPQPFEKQSNVESRKGTDSKTSFLFRTHDDPTCYPTDFCRDTLTEAKIKKKGKHEYDETLRAEARCGFVTDESTIDVDENNICNTEVEDFTYIVGANIVAAVEHIQTFHTYKNG